MGYTEMSRNDELVTDFLYGGMCAVSGIRPAEHSAHTIIPAAHPDNFQFFCKHTGAVYYVKSEIYPTFPNMAVLINHLQ